MKAALYGDIVGHSDFELNLRPPGTSVWKSMPLHRLASLWVDAEESTWDIQESLDHVMKVGDIGIVAHAFFEYSNAA